MTGIEWTDAIWNPIVGCSVVSAGCTNCYAMRMAHRLEAIGVAHYAGTTQQSKAEPVWSGAVRQAPERTLTAPLRLRRPKRVFVNSMGDLFHTAIPDAWIDDVFAVMALAPHHTFQVLTKRPERMRKYMSEGPQVRIADAALSVGRNLPDGHIGWQSHRWKPSPIKGCIQPAEWPLPNVWLGTSVEDQATADERIPYLLDTPAAIRFVSAEPLLGPVDLDCIWDKAPDRDTSKIDALAGERYQHRGLGPMIRSGFTASLDWVIVGGESGPGARPCDLRWWIRQIVNHCGQAGVPVFVKQLGGHVVEDGKRLTLKSRKGADLSEWPEDLRVRQWP
ncbi:MAG: phage Gp37/Gp68 family protein [Candidatus Competibacteraceae bacterium]|nr:MAG: phage Gp37/Gp68 family protein [Candidatus Competibacteraceae bacterium]